MRKFSAGGVVVRRMHGRSWVAAIRPRSRPPGHWALPKGLVDPGERAVETAVREVHEETGLEARVVRKLNDARYVYTRNGMRIFKVVSYWLMHPVAGRLGAIDEAMRIEVDEARWLPLEDAPAALAYRSEKALVATLLVNEAQVAV
jgi:8-oxo-dGTP pyrophosphatase MutT (NUDIX family)